MNKSYLTVIGNCHFRNLWLGQITSQIALNMLAFVLAIRVYQETASNTAVSLMLLTFGVPAIVFGVIAGGIVDQFDKRDILIFCNISRVLVFIVFFLCATSLSMLYFLNIVISIITQLFIPAEAPLIPHLIKKDNLLSANSLFTISFYLSTMTGFIISGPILKFLGPRDVYLPMMVFMILSTLLVLRLPKPQIKVRLKTISFSSIGRNIDYGICFIRNHSRIKQSLILMTFVQALIATLSVLAPGFADRILAIELTDASYLVLGPAAVGLVLGSLWVGGYGVKFLKGTIILSGILATGVNLILLSTLLQFIRSLPLAMVLLFFLGVFNSFITVPSTTILLQETHGEIRGRVYGVLTSLTGGVSVLPVVFSGVLADFVGVGQALFTIGNLVFLTGVYNYLKRRKTMVSIR